MRASQRERERKEKEGERESTRVPYASVRSWSRRSLCVPCVLQYVFSVLVATPAPAPPPFAVSLDPPRLPLPCSGPGPPPPSTCPSTAGSAVLSVSRSSSTLSPPSSPLLAVYLSRSLPFSHVAAVVRACRVCGPRSVRPRAQICARRPHDDRERGFGWI